MEAIKSARGAKLDRIHAAHAELVELVGPTVERYRDDLLVHDLNSMIAHDGEPCLIWAYDCGTHFAPLSRADKFPIRGTFVPYLFGTANREQIADGVVDLAMYCRKHEPKSRRVFHWDGRKWREIDVDEAAELAKEWRRQVFAK